MSKLKRKNNGYKSDFKAFKEVSKFKRFLAITAASENKTISELINAPRKLRKAKRLRGFKNV